jgi:hypothetical protein
MERGRNTTHGGPDVLIAINQRSEVGVGIPLTLRGIPKIKIPPLIRRWSFIYPVSLMKLALFYVDF